MNKRFVFIKAIFSIYLAVMATGISSPAAFALSPKESTRAESFPHILKVETYTLNTRNVKVLKAQGDFLWIGTTLGVIRYDIKSKEDYTIFDNKNSLLSNGIFSIQFDPKGQPWIGTYGGGLSWFDGKQWININTPQGLADAFVFDILFTSEATWIATWSGINQIRGNPFTPSSWKTFTVENTKNGLVDNWVYAIQIDRQGRLWFGTESGISAFNGTTWKSWNHKQRLGAAYDHVAAANSGITTLFQGGHHSNHYSEHNETLPYYRPNYVLCLVLDKDQSLWVGTWGGGLSQFDTKTQTFRNFTTQEGLPGNFILALKEDVQGDLWIGTNNGLSRFNGQIFTNFGKINGLNSDFIFSLEITDDDSLWLGGHHQLNRLRLNSQTRELATIE